MSAGCLAASSRESKVTTSSCGVPAWRDPVVIKMDRDLAENIIRSDRKTLAIDRAEFERQLGIVRKRRS